VTVSGQVWWPSAGSFVAAYGQDLMTADTGRRQDRWWAVPAVNAVYMVNRSSLEQAVTPPSLRGRVQASRIAAHAASGTLGILLGGILGEQFGRMPRSWSEWSADCFRSCGCGGRQSAAWMRFPTPHS